MPLISPPLAPDRVRLTAVPALDPPFLDGLTPDPLTAAQPSLLAPTYRAGRLGPGSAGVPSGAGDPAPRPARPAPDPRAARRRPPDAPPLVVSQTTRTAAVRFVQTVMEIFNGYRPPAHARILAAPAAALTVHQEVMNAMRRLGRPSAGDHPGRLTVRRMRVCEPRPGVAEISLVLARVEAGAGRPPRRSAVPTGAAPADGRVWAAAFRIERLPGGWRCTAAHLL